MKKILSVLMAIAICLSVTTIAFASESTDSKSPDRIPRSFSINTNYNEQVSMGVLQEYSKEEITFSKSKDTRAMTFAFESKDNYYYTATGTISLPDGEKEYRAEGAIESFTLSDRTTGGIGNLIGTVDKRTINISVHLLPEKGLIFAYVTVGELSDNTKYLTFTYGELFDEMNELVDAYVSNKEGVVTAENVKSPERIVKTIEGGAKAAGDYNTNYRNISVGTLQLLNGNSVQLAAVTVYTPKRMLSNANYKSSVKVNGSTNNAYIYAQGAYLVPGVLRAWTSSGTCKLNSSDDFVDFSEMDPGNESWSVSIPIPYYIGGSFGWLPWNINIGFSTIKTERTKNNANSACYGNALWKHNYSKNVDWDSNGPAATEIGFAGAATTTYYFNRDYDYTTYVYGSGSVSYQYSSQFGVTQYTGGFTCNTGSASASIVIDKRP